MKSDAASTIASALAIALLCGGCGGTSDDGLYGSAGGSSVNSAGAGGHPNGAGGTAAAGGAIMTSGSCSDVEGLWAIFVEVGVDWQSTVIKPGAGTTKQWILSQRTIQGGRFHETARVCGVGAQGVPIGSPWFSIVDIPPYFNNEWTGVHFDAAVFDSGKLPEVEIWTTVTLQDPAGLQVGDRFQTEAKPFLLGAEGLAPDAPWPATGPELEPLVVDHDGDGMPGITGSPFTGPVPGEDPSVVFSDPPVGIADPVPRTQALYMAVQTRAALDGELVSCDPPRVEGVVVEGSLRIDSRASACAQSGTGELCTPDQLNFLNTNLPVFKFNGTSVVVGYKVPDGTTCAQVREMKFERTK